MSKVAFLFPGQGSQSIGMGRALYNGFTAASDVFKRADNTLGRRISSLCFDGPEAELLQTINTQPALYVTSAAALAVLLSESPLRPAAVAGHSVGEYAALYAAGAFGFETGLSLVAIRAKAMQEAALTANGAMAAILGLSAEDVKLICRDAEAGGAGIVEPANYNSPGQVVISGESAAVDAASELARERGAKRALRLNVSGAFHSRLMASAAARMAEALAGAEIVGTIVPLIANVTADAVTSAAEIRRNLAAQVDHSVRWEETLLRLRADGFDRFVEVGHGSVLTGLVKRTLSDARCVPFGKPEDIENVIGLGE